MKNQREIKKHCTWKQYLYKMIIFINFYNNYTKYHTNYTADNPGYQYLWKNVYLGSGRKTLSSMPGLQPGVIGAEDVALLVEAFASTFLPNIIAKVDRSATLSTSFSGGQITAIEIINGGWLEFDSYNDLSVYNRIID